MDRKFEHSPLLQDQALSPEALLWIAKIEESALASGTTGYLKGGVLRDYFSNIYNGTTLNPKDLDVMLLGKVNLTASEMVKRGAEIQFRRNRRKTPVFELALPANRGPIRAEIGIILANALSYEREQSAQTLIVDDAKLSDFTVNTLLLPLGKTLDITNIIDPLGGIKDIRDKKIRMVSPNTFVRNPECMIRAVRIADRINATIESETAEAIKYYAPYILKAPQVVIDDNIKQIQLSSNRDKNIEMLNELNLLRYLHL